MGSMLISKNEFFTPPISIHIPHLPKSLMRPHFMPNPSRTPCQTTSLMVSPSNRPAIFDPAGPGAPFFVQHMHITMHHPSDLSQILPQTTSLVESPSNRLAIFKLSM